MNSPIDPEKIKSILIIRFQRLGDLMLAMTLVQNLRVAFPAARITLLCQQDYSEFLRRQPGVDEVIAIPKKAGLGAQLSGWAAALRSLIAMSFDLVIDLSDNRRSSQLTRLTNAPLRVGFWPPARASARRSILETGAYNIFAPLPSNEHESQHFVHHYLSPLRALGLPVRCSRPVLASTSADRAVIERILGQRDIARGPHAVIHPGARTTNRRWPAKNYPPVIEHLSKRGISVVLIGGDEERPLTKEIAAVSSVPFTDLVGRLSLGELAALLEGCCLYIGNNTGPIHIAAGVGARIVAIYGIHPIHDALWAPLTDRHMMMTPPKPCDCLDPTTCRPHDPDRSLCVGRNSVADVLHAIDVQLSAGQHSQHPGAPHP
jgi:lipopolysaccharide heptosyltransferase III